MEYFSTLNGKAVKDAFARDFVARKAENTDCFNRSVKDSVEHEWINPHMVPGTEYRTIERFNGKPVYTKLCVMNGDEIQNPGSFVADTYPVRATVVDIKAIVVIESPSENRSYPLPAVTDSNGVYQGDYVMASNYRAIMAPDMYTSGEVMVTVQNVDPMMEYKNYYVTIKYIKP